MMIRNFEEKDIPQVIEMLEAGRPYTMAHHQYSYWMLSEYLSELCFVAEEENRLVGYVGCLASPVRACTFIWQIAVDGSCRGKGLGSSLLDQVVESTRNSGYRSIQFSVNEENDASNAVFRRCAQRLGSEVVKVKKYADDQFEEYVYEIRI